MSDSLPYADVIILALIAGFLILRLRGILGQKIGHDSPPPLSGENRDADSDTPVVTLGGHGAEATKALKNRQEDQLVERIENAAARTGIETIRDNYKDFSVVSFMDGARGAFEMAFDAFAKDSRDVLKMLLSPELFTAFTSELDARKATENKPETTLVSIVSQDITGAVLEKSTARITLRFVSEQVTVVRDKDGKIVEGNPASPEHVEDLWTFERDLTSRSPNWKIIDT